MAKSKMEVFDLKNGKEEIKLVYPELRKVVLILRAIGHDLRKKIVDLLRENETMNVTDIYVKLRIEQSVASQHLAILRKAGIVITKRNGKFIYYTLNNDRLNEVSILVEQLAA
ncbi:MAG: Transcriptional regulator [uncultured Aureispira sp.]|uniref:Transcriptional regulator n=1 Tax=uncultured Aureispira sp. TaxID=1331704 RepID=A0A6S6UI11_9BACT|nr:MAG: Transcriptional regulator [uncultured Aureispira sp.]